MLTIQDCVAYTQSKNDDEEIAGAYIMPYGECGCLGTQVLRFLYPERDVMYATSFYTIDDQRFPIPDAVDTLCHSWYSAFWEEASDAGCQVFLKKDWVAYLFAHEDALEESVRTYLHAVAGGVDV